MPELVSDRENPNIDYDRDVILPYTTDFGWEPQPKVLLTLSYVLAKRATKQDNAYQDFSLWHTIRNTTEIVGAEHYNDILLTLRYLINNNDIQHEDDKKIKCCPMTFSQRSDQIVKQQRDKKQQQQDSQTPSINPAEEQLLRMSAQVEALVAVEKARGERVDKQERLEQYVRTFAWLDDRWGKISAHDRESLAKYLQPHTSWGSIEVSEFIDWTLATNRLYVLDAGVLAKVKQAAAKEITAEETTMPEKKRKDVKNAAKDAATSMADAFKQGAMIAGSKRAAKEIVNLARQHLGDAYPDFFDTELGRRIEPIILIYVVTLFAEMFQDSIPQADKVKIACSYAMTGISEENMSDLIGIMMPMFTQIANLAPTEGQPLPPAFNAEFTEVPKTKKKEKVRVAS